MERKSSKEYSVVFLMEGEKFKLRNFEDFILVVGSAANSVGTMRSQHLAVVPTPNIAELGPSVFSVHNHGFCGRPNTFSQEKRRHVHVDRHLVTGKGISSKINFIRYCRRAWRSRIVPACDDDEPRT